MITIAVTNFNLEDDLIRECLGSLRAQSFETWHAVVVDDASTEGDARGVVADMNDRRITYIRHGSNKGVAAARNLAFRSTDSEMLVSVDGDDRLAPTFLARTYEALVRSGSDCAFTDYQLFGMRHVRWHLGVESPRDMLRHMWVPGGGALMRRRLFEAVGGFDESLRLSDWDFWIAATEIGFSAVHVPEPLYEYRQRAGSVSHSTTPFIRYRLNEYLYDKHRAMFDRYGAGKEFLADGYRTSARAVGSSGNRRQALALSAHAVRLEPRSSRSWKTLLRTALPEPMARAIAGVRR